MKRDMDLVRSIMLQVEAADGPLNAGRLNCSEHSEQEVLWHVDLMVAHGLIDGRVERAWGGNRVTAHIDGLTWEGLDMLDAMRSERVWERAKEAVRRAVGSTTLDVIKATCATVAADMISAAL